VARTTGRAHAATLEVDLRLPHATSLKDKRAVLRAVLDGARNRYRVASAEVGFQDLRQRALLGFAAVAGAPGHVTEVLDEVERFVWSFPEVEVVSTERDWVG
jgi:uncharacterized protein YlxP (DUF503 family)